MYKPRILIVDDEAEAGEILSLRLGRRGFAPAFVTSGEAALEYLKANAVDVVLLDIKMPGMDGFETLGHIRAEHPGISVIILSGHADVQDAARGMELGAFFYLLKPVNLEELCNKIEDARRMQEHGSGAWQ
jgi:DNA-binding response OmpR family regulator